MSTRTEIKRWDESGDNTPLPGSAYLRADERLSRETCTKYRLTDDQIAEFHEHGLLKTFKLCEPEQMAKLNQIVRRDVIENPSQSSRLEGLPPHRRHDVFRYLDMRLVYDLCTLPAFIEPITQLLGSKLMLYKTQFFDKAPFGPSIPWHQESPNWAMEGVPIVSVWLAFDESPVETGCMRVIPGTHDRIYKPQPLAPGQRHLWPTFKAHIPIDAWAPDSIVNCDMRAGEFMFFADLVHGSEVNNTPNQRLGFTARYTSTDVVLDHDMFYPGHAAVVVRGTEANPLNHMLPPPEYGTGPQLDSLIC